MRSVLVALTDLCKRLQTFSTAMTSIVYNRSHLQFWQIPCKPLTRICIWSLPNKLGSFCSSLYLWSDSDYLDKRKLSVEHNYKTIALISCSATKAPRAYSSAKSTGFCKWIQLELPNSTNCRRSLSPQQPYIDFENCGKQIGTQKTSSFRECWDKVLCTFQGFSTHICILQV